MPYKNEKASGDSLIWLENSKALKAFQGIIQVKPSQRVDPPVLQLTRNNWYPRRVIAIDGSNLMHRVNNGFPGAEAGLLMISVVAIKLELLQQIKPGDIPRPSFFRDIEKAHTLESALPGIGVVRRNYDDDTPLNFFRDKTFDTISSSIAKDHETLLETLDHICRNANFKPNIGCPVNGCEEKFHYQKDSYLCNCSRKEMMYQTDLLRLHDYFDNNQSAGEALGRLRSVLEILILINILRFFESKVPEYLKDCAFVLDGPLAIFGTPASILRPVREELRRLNQVARACNKEDIIVFGIEKTGRMKEHFEQLDHDDEYGPRTRFDDQTVIAPDDDYIHTHIIKSNTVGKPFGSDTHFGRVLLYKTNKGKHVVLHTAMLNDKSSDFNSNSIECYPRLTDVLDVVDSLATHIYDDGFMPLVRAHAHAAIPLKRGTDIIKSLLSDE